MLKTFTVAKKHPAYQLVSFISHIVKEFSLSNFHISVEDFGLHNLFKIIFFCHEETSLFRADYFSMKEVEQDKQRRPCWDSYCWSCLFLFRSVWVHCFKALIDSFSICDMHRSSVILFEGIWNVLIKRLNLKGKKIKERGKGMLTNLIFFLILSLYIRIFGRVGWISSLDLCICGSSW